MKSYLDLIQKVFDKGQWKENRTGIRCLTVPATHWEHDMQDGFPALTTKKLAFKTMCVELEGFINGITSKQWYLDRRCQIWQQWANPYVVQKKLNDYLNSSNILAISPTLVEEIRQKIQFEEDDLGSFYAHQLRHFGQSIDENDNGVLEGTDQLKNIIETLKTNPNDRRMLVSYWNPNQLSRYSLPACHLLWNLVHINGVVSLHWHQRSCDLLLGVPFNIASYALLLELICKTVDMKPGQLSATFCDLHIYENHIDGAKEQLTRIPLELPQIEIVEPDIFKWTHKDVKLLNYQHHESIKMEVAI